MPLQLRLHNALREDMGLEETNHCGECWGVMENGFCKLCGGTGVYDGEL